MAATEFSSFGKININGKPYSIAPEPNAYVVDEVPSHGDVDQKMERRVISRSFSGGIQKRREEPSLDATSTSSPSFSLVRQNRVGAGIAWANGGDTRQQDRIFCQRRNQASNFSNASAAPFLIGDASTYGWAISANAIYALTTPPDTWTLSASTSPTVTDAVQYGGYLYVAVGNSNNFYTWSQASATTVWTQRTSAANNFVVIRNQLWRSNNANIYSTTDTNPASQVWSTATVIGDPSSNITYLDLWEDFIIVFKQDGIYSADKSGNVYPIFPGFKNLGMNPRPIGQWRDNYYFASDFGLVWEVSKSTVRRIGFDMAEPFPMGGNSGNAPTYSIPYVATRGVATTNYLLVGFNQYNADSNGGAYYLAWDGDAWHPFAYFTNSSVNGLGMTGGQQSPVNPVLQFSNLNRGANNVIFYQTNPLIDPFLADSFDTTSQQIYLTADNGVLEDEAKVLERVNVWVDNFTSGTVRIAYAIDEDIADLSFVDMGVPVGNGSQSSQQFNPPSPFPTYRKIQLRITLQADSSTSSPMLRYVIMHYKQRTPQRKVWQLKLLADKHVLGSTGRLDVRDTSKILSDLNTARQSHHQVDFTDLFGAKHTVYVDQVGEGIAVLRAGLEPSFFVNTTLVEAADEQVVQ